MKQEDFEGVHGQLTAKSRHFEVLDCLTCCLLAVMICQKAIWMKWNCPTMKRVFHLVALVCCLSGSKVTFANTCTPADSLPAGYIAPNQFHLIFNNQTAGDVLISGHNDVLGLPVPPHAPGFSNDTRMASGQILPAYPQTPKEAQYKVGWLGWSAKGQALMYSVKRGSDENQVIIESVDGPQCPAKPSEDSVSWKRITPNRLLENGDLIGACVYQRTDIPQNIEITVKTTCLSDGVPQLLVILNPA